ncbi:helix-turn-helix domain-containing protein [Roseibium aquae]|nr:helix-turn-helix transcriptional regulator [Roseibium aquae]
MTKRYERPLSIEELASLSDDDIDFSDIPELDASFFENALVVDPTKQERVTLAPRKEVIKFFKERHPHDFLAAMSSILCRYVADRSKRPLLTDECVPAAKDLIAEYIQRRKLYGAKQRDIAAEAGYDKPNNISMLKTGATKVPLDKIPSISRALGIDPILLLRSVIYDYHPEWKSVLEDIVGGLTTNAEREILAYIREISGKDDLHLTEDVRERLRAAFETTDTRAEKDGP